jgi:hypothetical protein
METTEAAVVAALAAAAAWTFLAFRRRDPAALRLRGFLRAILGFILFMSLLSGRHVPYISGYVYGSAFAVLFSCAAGLAVSLAGEFGKTRACALAVGIAAVQAFNFQAINRPWVDWHNAHWPARQRRGLTVAAGRTTSRRELREIHRRWQERRLDEYISETPVSSGALFLIYELRRLDDPGK